MNKTHDFFNKTLFYSLIIYSKIVCLKVLKLENSRYFIKNIENIEILK
jgi:hypothetical protein